MGSSSLDLVFVHSLVQVKTMMEQQKLIHQISQTKNGSVYSSKEHPMGESWSMGQDFSTANMTTVPTFIESSYFIALQL